MEAGVVAGSCGRGGAVTGAGEAGKFLAVAGTGEIWK